MHLNYNMRKILALIAALFVFCSFLQKEVDLAKALPVGEATISLVFAGDIMGHSPQFQAAYNKTTKKYNYDICFQYVKPYIASADFAIANLEVPLAGLPYSGYPNFSSPDALLDGLKNSGYDVMLTANNHVLDRSKNGLERTLRIIKNRNLKHAGSYLNLEQRDSTYPLILESKGVRIALLNCTYGTNGMTVTAPNIVNYIDTVQIKSDIRKSEILGADLTIMTIHWGTEYELKANISQVELAKFLAREGVDMIIGSHPHVVQNFEYINPEYQNMPVFYSLGNSISNQRKPNTDGGIMVKAEINVFTKRISSVNFLPVYVHKGYLNNIFQYHLIPTIDYIKSPDKFNIPSKDSVNLHYFDTETRKRLSNVSVWDTDINL